jgi:hypothetical protein
MNRVYKIISLPANLLLTALVSPAIFTLLTIKQNTLKQQRKDCSNMGEKKDFGVLQIPPSD